jgi:hypothetical protein
MQDSQQALGIVIVVIEDDLRVRADGVREM